MKKKSILLSAITLLTTSLLFTSCKKNEAVPTETPVATETAAPTPTDTTKTTATIAKDTVKSSKKEEKKEKGEKKENEKNEKE